MKKLWKVTVRDFGCRSSKTLFFDSHDSALRVWADYPVADPVKYAGRFTDDHAAFLLADHATQYYMLSCNRDLYHWFLRLGVDC